LLNSRYDAAEHLRIPKEMAAYLEACIQEAEADAAFIAKALGENARAKPYLFRRAQEETEKTERFPPSSDESVEG
jgi:hypothetical protein